MQMEVQQIVIFAIFLLLLIMFLGPPLVFGRALLERPTPEAARGAAQLPDPRPRALPARARRARVPPVPVRRRSRGQAVHARGLPLHRLRRQVHEDADLLRLEARLRPARLVRAQRGVAHADGGHGSRRRAAHRDASLRDRGRRAVLAGRAHGRCGASRRGPSSDEFAITLGSRAGESVGAARSRGHERDVLRRDGPPRDPGLLARDLDGAGQLAEHRRGRPLAASPGRRRRRRLPDRPGAVRRAQRGGGLELGRLRAAGGHPAGARLRAEVPPGREDPRAATSRAPRSRPRSRRSAA